MNRYVELIGVAMGLGGPDAGAAAGPARLRRAGLIARLAARGVDGCWARTLRPRADATSRMEASRELNERLAQRVHKTLAVGNFPLVLGGDHSIAAGTWVGVSRALGGVGLVWIDAHMDAHTHATSPSGNPHGMPLATLLGADYAPAALVPTAVALIGIRSYEADEAALLRRLGVRIYFQVEVDRRGIDAVLGEAIRHVCVATGRFGITVDVDAISTYDAPGTSTRAGGGIAARELLHALDRHTFDPRLVAAELVEFAPRLDTQGRTLELALELASRLAASARQ